MQHQCDLWNPKQRNSTTIRETTNSKLTCFIEEEGILILLHVLRGSGLIQEQRVNPFNVLHLNFCPLKKPKHTHDHWTLRLQEIITTEKRFLRLCYSCSNRICLPCVCDTPSQQCWSAGWRSAVTSPCRCGSVPCEPPRSAPHPPPHTWNETIQVHFTFTTLGGRRAMFADKMMDADLHRILRICLVSFSV